MQNNKTTDNCLKCGKFYNVNNSKVYCPSCSKGHCRNCHTPLKDLGGNTSKASAFCDSTCQEEYQATKEVEQLLPIMAKSLERLHRSVCNFHKKPNLSYNNLVDFKDGEFRYKYDSKADEIKSTLNMKSNLTSL